jgi:hypothetical protein
MEFDELKQRIKKSADSFVTECDDLLMQDPNETSITTELKNYLEKEFTDWDWDINHQYDKRIIENEVVQKRINFARESLPKNKIPMSIPLDSEIINKLIIPDIIFHDKHSQDHNFLVIEVKLSTNKNKDDRIFDRLKLEVTTSKDLKYEWDIFLDFTSGKEFNPDNPYQIDFFRDGVCHEEG